MAWRKNSIGGRARSDTPLSGEDMETKKDRHGQRSPREVCERERGMEEGLRIFSLSSLSF